MVDTWNNMLYPTTAYLTPNIKDKRPYPLKQAEITYALSAP
jgi:hypothetical protein